MPTFLLPFLLGGCVPDVPKPGDLQPADTGTPDESWQVSPGLDGLAELGIRNVVFVHVDTLRADHLPMYGSARNTLPTVGDLPWLVVHGLHAPTSWTVPSTLSLLTTLDIAHHGISHMRSDGQPNAPFTAPTVGRTFAEAGFATYADSGNEALLRVAGVFDDFGDVSSTSVDGSDHVRLREEVAGLFAWRDQSPDQPFFAFLQPMDMHQPYRPYPEHLGTWSDPDTLPFDVDASDDQQAIQFAAAYAAAETDDERRAVLQQAIAVYDEDLLGVDDGFAALVAGLKSRGLLDETLIVFAGDHGETLGEEQNPDGTPAIGHGGQVRPELVQLPLLFYNPHLPGSNVDCLSQNVDVMPTLLAALGLPTPDRSDGHALQDGCRATTAAATWFKDVDDDELCELGAATGTSFVRWSCTDGAVLRYDLLADPAAQSPLDAADFPDEGVLKEALASLHGELDATFGPEACLAEE